MVDCAKKEEKSQESERKIKSENLKEEVEPQEKSGEESSEEKRRVGSKPK